MKRLIVLLLISLLPSTALAQSTTVSATVVDGAGQAWTNGSFRITFVPKPGVPGPYIWTGGALTTQFSGALDPSGSFTISIPSNNAISPAGSQWDFTLTPNSNAPAGDLTLSLSGSTVNLSTAITAAIPRVKFSAGQVPFGYNDTEVTPVPAPGGAYFNTGTSNCLRVWNGGAWSCSTGTIINLSSPPPIGNVTPNTGAFTTLTSTNLTSNVTNGVCNAFTAPGADMCAKINNVVTTAPGCIIDARQFPAGNNSCASNPFANQTADVILYLGEGQNIQTSANWVTNAAFNNYIYGAGRGSGGRGTTIQVTAGFPATCDGLATNNCPLLRLGNGSSAFAQRFQNATLDCNGNSTCIGMYSTDLNEQSGMFDFQVLNYSNIGILIDGSSNAGSGPFWSQNYTLRDGEVYALNFGTSSTIGLKLIGGNNAAGGETAPRLIEDITASGNVGHAIGTAFQMEQWWGGQLIGLNAENATTGYQFGIAKPMNGVSGFNLRCANVATNCVLIPSNSPFSNNIILQGVQNTPTVATNTINDQQQSVAVLGSTDPTVGLYLLGQGYAAGGITNFNSSSVTGSIQMPALTLYNGADTPMTFFMNSGRTVGQGQTIQFQSIGVNKYAIQNTSANQFLLQDNTVNLGKLILNSPAGLTNLNSSGTQPVAINENTNAGTGGFQVWSGGPTPTDNFVVGSNGSLSFGGGQTLTNSNQIPDVGTSAAGQAVCQFSAGPPQVLGHCTSAVGAGGACTCVN